jgi:hypothetical protein
MTPIAARGIRTFDKLQSWGMEHMSENGELTLRTYEVATNRLNAVDQWAHNFVNLYFVLCAALIAAAGYAVTIDETNKLYLYPFNSLVTARQFCIWGASIRHPL